MDNLEHLYGLVPESFSPSFSLRPRWKKMPLDLEHLHDCSYGPIAPRYQRH